MNEDILIIAGDSPTNPLLWVGFTDLASLPNMKTAGSLTDLVAMLQNFDEPNCYLVLESPNCIARRTELPAKTDIQARAAAPFILEDDLASNSEDLHFALSENNDGSRQIVYLDDNIVAEWTQAFKGADIKLSGLYADHTLFEPFDGQNTLIELENGDYIAALTSGASMHVEAALAPAILPDLVGSENTGAEKLTRMALTQRYLKAIEVGKATNLLQGTHAPRKPWRDIWLLWRRAAILGGLLVAVWGGSFLFETWSIAREIDQVDAATQEAIKAAFPEARSVAQVQARLRTLRHGDTSQFIQLSSILFAGLQENEGASILALRYDEARAELAVNLTTSSFANIEQIKTSITRFGGEMIEGGSRQDNGRIIADIIIRRAL